MRDEYYFSNFVNQHPPPPQQPKPSIIGIAQPPSVFGSNNLTFDELF
jgi:hypothetical protein